MLEVVVQLRVNFVLYLSENVFVFPHLTLLHSEGPKLARVLAVLSAIGLSHKCFNEEA